MGSFLKMNSNRLLLTEPQPQDFTRFYEIHSDPETNLFNPNGPMSFETATKAFTKMTEHWALHGFGSWSIREKENPSLIIGFGGLDYRLYVNEMKLNLGYRFDKNFWGKGYATELAQKAIEVGFTELHKKEIFAIVRPAHLVSIKVLEKCGMQLNGELNDVEHAPNSLVYKIEQ